MIFDPQYPIYLYPEYVDMRKGHNTHLATWKGQAVGTFGAAGTFSFYPGKNLGAYGDAGFVIVPDKGLLDTVSMYLNHGRMSKYKHQFTAENYRMDDIQAAILSVKCRYLRQWTDRRIAIAKQYDDILKPKGYKVIEVKPES